MLFLLQFLWILRVCNKVVREPCRCFVWPVVENKCVFLCSRIGNLFCYPHHTVCCMSFETSWRRPRGRRSLTARCQQSQPSESLRFQVETCAQLGGFCETHFLFNVIEDGKLPNTTCIAEGAICVSRLCTDHVFVLFLNRTITFSNSQFMTFLSWITILLVHTVKKICYNPPVCTSFY